MNKKIFIGIGTILVCLLVVGTFFGVKWQDLQQTEQEVLIEFDKYSANATANMKKINELEANDGNDKDGVVKLLDMDMDTLTNYSETLAARKDLITRFKVFYRVNNEILDAEADQTKLAELKIELEEKQELLIELMMKVNDHIGYREKFIKLYGKDVTELTEEERLWL